MGETAVPATGSALTRSVAAQTYTFPSVPSPTSDDESSSIVSPHRRRAAQSRPSMWPMGQPIEQDKPRRAKSIPNRGALARGSIMTMPDLLAGEEITYTPTTHRISKAKKGKKVHAYYLQAPQPLPQQYYASDFVQRPHSAIETCYQSMEASPLSVGPAAPVQGWSNYDPAALGFAAETQCMLPVSVQAPFAA
ncbi:MAG: hypothetical protein Q9217_005908 [Psora testacea]